MTTITTIIAANAAFAKILVGIDSSDESMDAADYAISLSKEYNAELCFSYNLKKNSNHNRLLLFCDSAADITQHQRERTGFILIFFTYSRNKRISSDV
jgi:hypothetical protein